MKIWLDLRFISDNIYSRFVIKMIESLIKEEKNKNFVIYTNSDINLFFPENCEIKKVNIKNWSLAEQTKFKKILKEEKFWLMIFFNQFKPIFYKKNYIILIWNLKDLYYSNFKNHFEKYKFLYFTEKNIKNATKVICLDKLTKNELIERFDVNENKISIIDWFFPFKEIKRKFIEDEEKNLPINIKTKYNIKNDYFIFSAWDSIEKNYEKLIKVLKRLKKDGINIDLVFLWNNIWKNINLRNLIIENKLQENIFFLWSPKLSEKKNIYENSLWVIFPSLYEPFPFRLTEPVYFDCPILSSNIKKIENIFWKKINYFSPISVNSIYLEVKNFLEKPKKDVNYDEIKEKYSVENSTKKLIEIIN